MEAVSQVGWFVLIGAVTVLVAAIAAMVVYTVRHGESDATAGKVVKENRSMTMSLGTRLPMGRSKRKILGSKSQFITMESLADGTATRGERMMVWGMMAAFTSFFLVFVGGALVLVKTNLFALVFISIPGLWFYTIATTAWRDYRQAKKTVHARRGAES